MGSVIYNELLYLPSVATAAAPPLDADGATRKRPRLADLIEQLDDRETALRTHRSITPAGRRKRKRLDALSLLSAPSSVDQ